MLSAKGSVTIEGRFVGCGECPAGFASTFTARQPFARTPARTTSYYLK